jgi:hypothetical protein
VELKRWGILRARALVTALLVGVCGIAVAPAAAVAKTPVSWTAGKKIDKTSGLVGVSCPSNGDCFALDANNRVFTTKDVRAGQRSRWVHEQLPGGAHGVAIDCPTTTFCVTLDSDSGIITSTDPLAGASATWHRLSLGSASQSFGFSAVSCVRRALCVAVGVLVPNGGAGGPSAGVALVSTDPAAGASARWVLASTSSGEISMYGVSCPSTRLCVAVDPGDIYTTVDPTEGASASWSTQLVPDDTNVDAVSCPSLALCMLVGERGPSAAVLTSTNPTKPARARWKVTAVKADGTNFNAVSCGAVNFCAAAGSRAASTTAPTTPGAWVPDDHVDGSSVSCGSRSVCATVDQQGYFFLATRS